MNRGMRELVRMVIFIVMLGAATLAHASDAFARGNEAYAKGDFEAARTLYTEAAESAPNANVWYNLGNAFFRLNQMGKAALAYERALNLAPSHAEAAENLKLLRQKSGARELDRGWLHRALAVVPPSVSPWLAVTVAWLGFAWAGSALWRGTSRWGVVMGIVTVGLGAAYGWGLAHLRSQQAREAVVLVASVEARSEPAEAGRPAEGLLAGSRVNILSTLGGWHFCQLPGGSRGWVPAASVESIVLRKP